MEFVLCWCCLTQCQFGNSGKQDFHVSLFFDVKFRWSKNFGRFENSKTLWCGFQMVFYCNIYCHHTVLTLAFFARAAWWSKKSVDTSSDLTPVLPGECRVNTHYLYSTKSLCCFCWRVCRFVCLSIASSLRVTLALLWVKSLMCTSLCYYSIVCPYMTVCLLVYYSVYCYEVSFVYKNCYLQVL